MNKYEIHPNDLPRPGWKQRIRVIALERLVGGWPRADVEAYCQTVLLNQVQGTLWLRKILPPNETREQEVYADNKDWVNSWIKDAVDTAEEHAR